MIFQLDQSGKIEQTNKDTILSLSDGYWDAVLVKAKTKRELQEIFRRNGQIRNFIIFTFCASITILLKRNLGLVMVIIDKEYTGKEPIIKKIILEMLKKDSLTIRFESIGKSSNAHGIAHRIAVGRLRAKKVITLSEILRLIKKTEVGKRLKDT